VAVLKGKDGSPSDPLEYARLVDCVEFGPWRTVSATGDPVGEMLVADEELRLAWETWARDVTASETSYGWHRFERDLPPAEAFAAAGAARG
jgi:hypothetical protein